MQRYEYYAPHLERVSRSFSFCIARLEGRFRDQVGLSYLILRVLDTIEDAPWKSFELQQVSFETFNAFILETLAQDSLSKKIDQDQWLQWVQSFPSDIAEHEGTLLRDSQILFQDLANTEVRARKAIIDSILNMSRGMMFFQSQFRDKIKNKNRIQIASLAELNGYCFFVAGVVGELLTELLIVQSQDFVSNSKVFSYAVQFGLFLQKINILKDQMTDEKEGRLLIQSRLEVLSSLKKDLEGAFEYLKSIPKSEVGYRLFCGWSLFVGLESLPWIQKSWALKILDKIPRAFTRSILSEIEKIILDDDALMEKYLSLKDFIPDTLMSEKNSSAVIVSEGSEAIASNWISSEAFLQLYHGRLQIEQLALLEILPGSQA